MYNEVRCLTKSSPTLPLVIIVNSKTLFFFLSSPEERRCFTQLLICTTEHNQISSNTAFPLSLSLSSSLNTIKRTKKKDLKNIRERKGRVKKGRVIMIRSYHITSQETCVSQESSVRLEITMENTAYDCQENSREF